MFALARTLSVLVLLCLPALSARADTPVNTNGTAYAVGGFDVVAYFTEGKPTRGSREHSVRYLGATWLFADAGHKQTFAANPAQFAPAFKGYCAYGVANHRLVSVDPQAFTVVKGKLYLNYSLDIRATWLRDRDAKIREAEAYWPKLAGE